MAFSVWATKPHEALMATYAIWAVWLLAALAWDETGPGRLPDWLSHTNPFWLLFGNRWGPAPSVLPERTIFLAGSLAISVVLASISTWRIRPVTLRQASRAASRRGPDGWLRRFGLPRASLDRDPVLWREQHRRRSSGWGRAIWCLYAVLSTSFTLLAIFANRNIAPGVGAFMVSIGLLMVSVTSATALAEERSLGSLDVLMATTLSTREIVLGKWRGAFRVARRLAILPGVLAFGSALTNGHGIIMAALFAALSTALVLAYGAVITSIGLALATWQPRLSRAVGSSVAAYMAVAVIYPAIVLVTFRMGPDDVVLLWLSPFFGMFIPIGWFSWRFPSADPGRLVAMSVWIAVASAVAYGLLRVTLANFDRFLGRTPEHPGRFVPISAPKSSKADSADLYSEWD
jgi:ABC-type transport system involved in multi-copper enzyme maturation permease subunit